MARRRPSPSDVDAPIPTDGPAPARPARARATARPSTSSVDGKRASRHAAERRRLGGRASRRRRRLPRARARSLEVADAGDFEQRPGRSPSRAWVKLPANDADRRDPRPHGRRRRLPRLGPVGRGRPRRHAHRQQVAGRRAQGRRQDAAASRTSGRTSSSPTTAPARRPASRSTSTASRSRRTSQADTLHGHDPHRRCRFKIGQRHTESTAVNGVDAPGRAHLRPGARRRRGRAARRSRRGSRHCSAKPADKRTAAETDELFDWWLATLDEPYAGARRQARRRCEQEQATIKARGTIAHVMQEKPEEADGVHPASAASTTSAATR